MKEKNKNQRKKIEKKKKDKIKDQRLIKIMRDNE